MTFPRVCNHAIRELPAESVTTYKKTILLSCAYRFPTHKKSGFLSFIFYLVTAALEENWVRVKVRQRFDEVTLAISF